MSVSPALCCCERSSDDAGPVRARRGSGQVRASTVIALPDLRRPRGWLAFWHDAAGLGLGLVDQPLDDLGEPFYFGEHVFELERANRHWKARRARPTCRRSER